MPGVLPGAAVKAGRPDIRLFEPGDDVEAELDLRRRAFGPIAAASRPAWLAVLRECIEAGQMIGVFDGGRLIASARYLTMRQWWHGRSMPMAGVAGVKVAPEHRGRGVGRAMLTRLAAEIAARGFPVAALYPTIGQLYRSVGWEYAGAKYRTVLPSRALAALVAADAGAGRARGRSAADAMRLRRATGADAAAVIDVVGRVHAGLRHCGPITREPAAVRRWLDNEDNFGYLADDGFLDYHWGKSNADLEVASLLAGSEPTARALWQIVASHASVAERVGACLGPDDPVSWLVGEPDASLHRDETWMLRLVDAAAAIAARGYPEAVSLTVPLDVADEMLPGNAGQWMLEVSGGAGRLRRAVTAPSAVGGAQAGNGVPGGARPAIRLGPRGLAAMFAGVPVATLRLAGLAHGGDAGADAALEAAFGGRAFMTDYF